MRKVRKMSKLITWRLWALVVGIVACFFFLAGLTLAQESTTSANQNQNIIVSKDEIIDHDFFAGGQTVTISGIVNGDVFVGANTILIDGKINGDLISGSSNLTVTGEVTDDVRCGGANIVINGIVGKNITAAGSTIIINESARIGGSVLAMGSQINVTGPIAKDLRIYANQANIDNQTGRNLTGAFNQLIIGSKAQILGDLDYESPNEAQIDDGALVSGEINYKAAEKDSAQADKNNRYWLGKAWPMAAGFYGIGLYFKFISVLIAFAFGLLYLYFFQKRIEGMVKIIGSKFWPSLGLGVLTPIVFGLGIIFLAVSLIGIPFIFIVLPIFAVLVWFSKLFVAFFVGNKILTKFDKSKGLGWALLVGLVAYYILQLIPFIGGLTSFVFTTVGLGAFVIDQKSRRQSMVKLVKSRK